MQGYLTEKKKLVERGVVTNVCNQSKCCASCLYQKIVPKDEQLFLWFKNIFRP